jgi:thymidylate synthase
LKATDFYYYLGNCHIYDNHIESLKEQITRDPIEFPTLTINGKLENINDYLEEMFLVDNYKFHEPIKMVMRK